MRLELIEKRSDPALSERKRLHHCVTCAKRYQKRHRHDLMETTK